MKELVTEIWVGLGKLTNYVKAPGITMGTPDEL